MNFYREIENNIRSIIKDLNFTQNHSKTLFDGLSVEKVKHMKHGDLATNIAMVMSGKIKKPVTEIAEKISKNIYRFMPIQLESKDISRIHGKNEKISKESLLIMIQFYIQLIKNIHAS